MKLFQLFKRERFDEQIQEWREKGTLDRNLASRATAKGHIHRFNNSAKPSKGVSSHVRARKEKWRKFAESLKG